MRLPLIFFLPPLQLGLQAMSTTPDFSWCLLEFFLCSLFSAVILECWASPSGSPQLLCLSLHPKVGWSSSPGHITWAPPQPLRQFLVWAYVSCQGKREIAFIRAQEWKSLQLSCPWKHLILPVSFTSASGHSLFSFRSQLFLHWLQLLNKNLTETSWVRLVANKSKPWASKTL